jgi:hypothetical protein
LYGRQEAWFLNRDVLFVAIAVAVVATVGIVVLLADDDEPGVSAEPGIGSKYVYEAAGEQPIGSELVGIGDEYVLSLSVLPKDTYVFIDRETGDVFLAGEPEHENDTRTWTIFGVRISVAKTEGNYNIVKIGVEGKTYSLNLEKSTVERGGTLPQGVGEKFTYEATTNAELSYADPTITDAVKFYGTGTMTVTAKAAAADGKRIFFTEYEFKWLNLPADLREIDTLGEGNGTRFYIADEADNTAIFSLYRVSGGDFGPPTIINIDTFHGRMSVKQFIYQSDQSDRLEFTMRVGEKNDVLYEAEARFSVNVEGEFTASANLTWRLIDHSP